MDISGRATYRRLRSRRPRGSLAGDWAAVGRDLREALEKARPVYWIPHTDCHWCERDGDATCVYECHPGQECVDMPRRE